MDIYGRPLDLNNILGGIQRNAAGNITFASTMRISFALINRQYEGTQSHTGSCMGPARGLSTSPQMNNNAHTLQRAARMWTHQRKSGSERSWIRLAGRLQSRG